MKNMVGLESVKQKANQFSSVTNFYFNFWISGDKLNPKEAQCKSYSEYAFCIQNTIADMVDSEVRILIVVYFIFKCIPANIKQTFQ